MLKFILFTLLFFNALQANIMIPKYSSSMDILKGSMIFVDKNSSYSFDQIKDNKTLFTLNTQSYKNYGYIFNSTVWIKLNLQNASSEDIEKLLSFNSPNTDIVNLYTEDEDGFYIEEKSGVIQEKKFKNVLKFVFESNFRAYEKHNYFLQIKSTTQSLRFTLTLEDENKLYQDELSHQTKLFAFFGLMFGLFIYNVFIYIFTKDKSYLFYLFFLSGVILNHLSISGVMNYILPYSNKSVMLFESYLSVFYIYLIVVGMYLFVRSFLKLYRFKELDKAIKVMITLNTVVLFVSVSHYSLDYIIYFSFINIIFLEFMAIFATLKKVQYSLYYLVVWNITIVGMLLKMFISSGVIDGSGVFFTYCYEISIAIEALLFSIILAFKIRDLEKNKADLFKSLENKTKTENIRLNELAYKRTKDLNKALNKHKSLLDELNHRVKNNMQFIVSFYTLSLFSVGNEQTKTKLKELELKVQSMSDVHEMLYNDDDIDKIDTQKYFTSLIDKLKNVYASDNIEIYLETNNITMDATKAMYCGIVVNELLLNSIKHAFKDDEGSIYISFNLEDDKTILHYKDSGDGFELKDMFSSFGLIMIQTLIQDQLQGTLKQEGSSYEIMF